jgi:hypothetical protein
MRRRRRLSSAPPVPGSERVSPSSGPNRLVLAEMHQARGFKSCKPPLGLPFQPLVAASSAAPPKLPFRYAHRQRHAPYLAARFPGPLSDRCHRDFTPQPARNARSSEVTHRSASSRLSGYPRSALRHPATTPRCRVSTIQSAASNCCRTANRPETAHRVTDR